MSKPDAPIRLGCVKYLNAQPLIHGWKGPVVFDHPAEICRQLAAGELDAALVSSFEYLRDPIYLIADDVAVATQGAVHSVFLAHRTPLEKIERIALDPASRTSVNLLRCLLAERGLHPRLGESEADARLLIGDQAIRFREQQGSAYEYLDLGQEWKRQTGWPFVFALWLIRPEVAEPEKLANSLRERRDANLRALDQVIAAQQEFPPAFCAHYFRECLYFHFGEAEKAGLLHFRGSCEKHGLLPRSSAALRLV
ncbi:MAG: menaquinone biosynthetic enzyme MqnA/MqnD family protein [Chthoniobacterales bacterium]